MLEIPCHIPKDPPTNDNSQFSCPYFSASITGVTKNWLAARADNKKSSRAVCRRVRAAKAAASTAPQTASPLQERMSNNTPAISPACILGSILNSTGAAI
uniref:Uncharacterized protein n=1 Tax=Neisseria meningitidis alpha153 TaxID=663926 RepID=C6SCM2_NEIME|nr:hypothetical protein predicted by Glimmer/Critica [Neisseria meningitidis alpha153]